MRLTFRISLLAIGLASLPRPGAASAGTLVEFPNLPGHMPANLSGYLARPDSGLSAELGIRDYRGEGPFPAVVVLHGCIGITGHFTGIPGGPLSRPLARIQRAGGRGRGRKDARIPRRPSRREISRRADRKVRKASCGPHVS